MRSIQVGDEGAHQPRLADARRQREAERREVALEVRDRRELGLDRLQRLRPASASFVERDDLADAGEDLQRRPAAAGEG